jgi:zinc/manganese transport system substrate-binding protein
MHSLAKISVTLVASVAAAALVGCSTPAPASDDGVISVVASTNVYGDIAERVGGTLIEVTSIIDDPSQDPHSFEADARVQLSLSKADVVIENGGGYDPFMQQLLTEGSTATVLTASDYAGDSSEPGFNEHVWYQISAMRQLTDALAEALSDVAPEHARDFEDNAADLSADLEELHLKTVPLKEEFGGMAVAAIEPLPGYLLSSIAVSDVTPAVFSEAVEEGSEISPAALREMLGLIEDGGVAAVIANDQTAGAETDAVIAAAERAGLPVVTVSETLPTGLGYVDWMSANIDNLATALRSSPRGAR